MSLRSPSPTLSEGEVLSGDEEKAISTHEYRDRDSKVNSSARHLHNGSSSRASRASHLALISKDLGFHFRDAKDVKPRERSRSPYRKGRSRSRSRSPYRAGKAVGGGKRQHEDDHYSSKGSSDPRRFKVHYEDRPTSRGSLASRPQRPGAVLDRLEPSRPQGQYNARKENDRGLGSDNGNGNGNGDRDRSRSPFRRSNGVAFAEDRAGRDGTRDRVDEDKSAGGSRRQSATSLTGSVNQGSQSKWDDSKERSLSQHPLSTHDDIDPGSLGLSGIHDESANNDGLPQAPLSEAEIIEQRRQKREAIKAKHKSQSGLLVQALEHNMPSAPATPAHDSSGAPSDQQSPPSSLGSPRTPHRDSPPDSPTAFVVNDDEELANRHQVDNAVNDEEGPSAADYDPNMDMQEDRPDHKRQDLQDTEDDGANGVEVVPESQTAPKQSKEFDMFADDDDDDMFATADSTARAPASAKQAKTLDESLLDNWDYPDGHYRIILGELLDGRYAVQQQIGKGTFATVVRAQDTRTGNFVAVKIACNNETMYKAGTKEMDFLNLLNQHDPEDKKHIIRLLRNFDHKGHLCLVFEALSADLREVLKKFGRNVGLNLRAIRSYAQQMFLALSHMKKCQILHADLKPDNVLVSEKRNLLKICDLGTAAFADDAEITPYLVSRFYRAPEVILGMPFDYAIDMWSIGCTLFELYTGRILFAGADNNQMLRVIQECRGKFPMRMLKRSSLADRHFDVDGNFFSQDRDKITGKATLRQLNFNKIGAAKDLRSRLSGNAKGMAPPELREHAAFIDLMEKCLQLDPGRRITPNDALRHHFVTHPTVSTEKPAAKVIPAMGFPRMK